MKFEDLSTLQDLMERLALIENLTEAYTRAGRLTDNGMEVPAELQALYYDACLPITQQFWAKERQAVVDGLAAIGVTVS